MTFQHPTWLGLTCLLVLLLTGLAAHSLRRREHLLRRFAASRLLAQLTETMSWRRHLAKLLLILLAAAGIGIALARPQYGVEWSKREARGLDVMFVLDCSKSMLASDLRPNRLERAKLAIRDLMERLESDRIGLVVFAGQAFLQTPLTLDYANFRESLNMAGPTSLTRGGSDLGRALEEAAEAFPEGNNVKVVVLLTDGEDLAGRAEATARRIAESKQIQVFAIGVGSPESTYLRIEDASGSEVFARDADGQPVRTRLDEATLQRIAEATGGRYARLGTAGLEELFQSLLAQLPKEARESELQEIPIERFQWPLGAALCLLIAEQLIRRGGTRRVGGQATALLMFTALALTPLDSLKADPEADTSNANGLPNDQQAYAALQAEDYQAAIEHYNEWLRQNADPFAQRDALYNMGHAQHQLARQSYERGDLETALEQAQAAEAYFKSAAEIDPNDPVIQKDEEQMTRVREAIEKVSRPEEANPPPEDSPPPQDNEKNPDAQQAPPEPEAQKPESSEPQDSPSEPSQKQESPEDAQAQEEDSSQAGEQPQNGDQSQGGDQSQSGEQSQANDHSSTGSDPSAQASPDNSGSDPSNERAAPDPSAERPTQEDTSDDGERRQPNSQSGQAEHSPSDEAAAMAQGSSGKQETGMSPVDAKALLDSLQRSERILPFTPGEATRGRPLQDW